MAVVMLINNSGILMEGCRVGFLTESFIHQYGRSELDSKVFEVVELYDTSKSASARARSKRMNGVARIIYLG